jgi:L-threonylcarbamoyladenylate synthase
MEIVEINPKYPQEKVLQKAVRVLKKGGVIIYPTDSSYGLGCDPQNTKAVNRVYKIKKRRTSRPFLMVAADKKVVEKYARFSSGAQKVAQHFWPGPLTIVFRVKPKIKISRKLVVKGNAAFRVPKNKFLLKLLKEFKKPLVSTSANISFVQEPIYDGDEVIKTFSKTKYRPDLILNAGRLPEISPSTVVDLTGGHPEILREGPIKKKELLKFLKNE